MIINMTKFQNVKYAMSVAAFLSMAGIAQGGEGDDPFQITGDQLAPQPVPQATPTPVEKKGSFLSSLRGMKDRAGQQIGQKMNQLRGKNSNVASNVGSSEATTAKGATAPTSTGTSARPQFQRANGSMEPSSPTAQGEGSASGSVMAMQVANEAEKRVRELKTQAIATGGAIKETIQNSPLGQAAQQAIGTIRKAPGYLKCQLAIKGSEYNVKKLQAQAGFFNNASQQFNIMAESAKNDLAQLTKTCSEESKEGEGLVCSSGKTLYESQVKQFTILSQQSISLKGAADKETVNALRALSALERVCNSADEPQ